MKFTPFFIFIVFCIIAVFTTPIHAVPVVYGYYPQWTRQTCPPDTLHLEPLTHVSHAFVKLTETGGIIVPPGMTQAHDVATLRGKSARKVILAVGGSGASSITMGKVLADTALRAHAVSTLTTYAEKHEYDGIEVDWEYPKTPADRTNLTLFLSDIRAALPTGILSVAIHCSKYSGAGIDVEKVAPVVDYIILMGYDYTGPWSEKSGHNAPMHKHHEESSVTDGVHYWFDKGIPPHKTLLGLPLYGRKFLCQSTGQSFKKSTSATYADIQKMRVSGWDAFWDYATETPYLYSPNRKWFLSYDDPRSLGIKIEFAYKKGMTGVAVWQITGDFTGKRHLLLPYISETCKTLWQTNSKSQIRRLNQRKI